MRTRAELIRDTEPFPDQLIKKTPPGSKRPALDYVAWSDYAQRLLLHHGGHRYEVTHVVHGGEQWSVAVRVWLSADEWYDGVGADSDADKAESQAYKRACAHAGIGLHLYGGYWLHERLKKDPNESGPS